MGGTGVASLRPMDAAYYNPAGIANAQKNHAALQSVAASEAATEVDGGGIYILDAGNESITKGGFSYQRQFETGPAQRKSQARWELSAAKYIKPGLAMGVAFTKQRVSDLLLSRDFVDYNLELGWLYNPIWEWGFGLLLEDVFTGKEGRQQPMASLGLEYRSKLLRLSFDSSRLLSAGAGVWDYGLGFELSANEEIQWRLGYLSQARSKQHFYTAGLSWQGPRLGLYYAFQSQVGVSANVLHSLDLRLFF